MALKTTYRIFFVAVWNVLFVVAYAINGLGELKSKASIALILIAFAMLGYVGIAPIVSSAERDRLLVDGIAFEEYRFCMFLSGAIGMAGAFGLIIILVL